MNVTWLLFFARPYRHGNFCVGLWLEFPQWLFCLDMSGSMFCHNDTSNAYLHYHNVTSPHQMKSITKKLTSW